MLQILNIENVALIDKATLHFDERLNVISGETGAGKSILLDSLSFVFGGRADRSLIRSGTNFMKVEAVFSCVGRNQTNYFKENFGIDCVDELFISRELDVSGKNTCRINGELVSVAVVKKICQMLVDVHGQSEHLAILDNDYQLKIVDMFGRNVDNLLFDLQAKIEIVKDIEKQIKELGGNANEKQNLIDLYSYQIQEIENAKIGENEFEDLTAEKKEMSQFEKVNDALKNSYSIISQSGYDDSPLTKLSVASKLLQSIENINTHYGELTERLKSSLIELQDIADTLNDDLNNVSFDENRFEYVDKRIDFLKTLFRKYGGNYDALMGYYNEISVKLDNLINSSAKYDALVANKEDVLTEIDVIQNRLHEERVKNAQKFQEELEKELKILGMPNARIEIHFGRIEERFSSVGYDKVEFMFSANLGFELKPLNKVVSGGEMSRVMLAYKIVLSSVDDIHTIVFDEIDSGLSGHIATVVAQYMARLSVKKQIIAVSHLPQICAMADKNIKVEKFDKDNLTHTQSKVLLNQDLFLEIARLMGADINGKANEIGKELKNKCDEYKNNLK